MTEFMRAVSKHVKTVGVIERRRFGHVPNNFCVDSNGKCLLQVNKTFEIICEISKSFLCTL